MNREQQEYDENICAKIYVHWLGNQQHTQWTFIRAEHKFPKLADNIRWEFVAHRVHNDEEWYALEVKSLVFRKGKIQHNSWRKLIGDVNKHLEGRLPGEYYLVDFPKYDFGQTQRKTLVDQLEKTVLDVAKIMREGEKIDIGPKIATGFNHWPNNTTKRPLGYDPETFQLRFPPHALLLIKNSDHGNSLSIPMSNFEGGWAGPMLSKALLDLLDLLDLLEENDKANTQLKLAKNKGAAKTILLLYEQTDFDPRLTAEVISNLDASRVSNIDEVHMVSTFGGEHIQQVWPKTE